MLEESAAEAVTGLQTPRVEGRGQPPAKVGDPPAQRVEERPVENDARVPRSRRLNVVEVDQTGDEIYHSDSSSAQPRGKPSNRV